MNVSRADKPQTRDRTRRDPRAFSLLELVMTMSIIGVAAAVAVPRFQSSVNHYHLENSAKRLAADIDAMRQRASMLSANQTIMFAEDGYKIMQVDGNGVAASRVVEFTEEPYIATLKWIIMDNSSDLVYDQFGLPRAGALIRVDAGGKSRLIQIAGATGKSEVTHEMTDADINIMAAAVVGGTRHNLAGKRARTLTPAVTVFFVGGET